jgi:hypothetical protein
MKEIPLRGQILPREIRESRCTFGREFGEGSMLVVEKGKTNYGVRLVSTEPIPRGQAFFHIRDFREVPAPTYQTIQVGPGRHIEELGCIAHLNHSCRPNVLVHINRLECIALTDIAPDEELTFFYPSTEWEMARPFPCQCGAPECVGRVAGARSLPVEVLSRYFINAHIREMIQADLSAADGQFLELMKRPAG